MFTDVAIEDRIVMSQRERDILKVMHTVAAGERSQGEAARLLDLSVRQVRRIQRKLEANGDAALVHGLRGQASNRRLDARHRQAVVQAYQRRYSGFGPTLASEKLAEEGLDVSADTLRRWLLAAGLWQRRRRRDSHRSRRPRRACFGELVQMDASIHDWLEGRGQALVLIAMIDDASNHLEARFYPAGTVETHMDLLGRWLRRLGRPLALYTDRHSIFEPQDKGRALAEGVTQFGRALAELDMELIRAHSPQAKGRIERFFGVAQDRWVKEMRLAGVTTMEQANALLQRRLLPEYNRRFALPRRRLRDAHRDVSPEYNLAAILSVQEERVVANDYTIRFHNQLYQLLKPIWPGQRGGKVVVEQRLDGSLAIRFKKQYLKFRMASVSQQVDDSARRPVEFSALAADANGKEEDRDSGKEPRSSGVQPTAGRSGRTPAEPYPPNGAAGDTKKEPWRPAEDHPWRKPAKPRK